MNVEEVGYRFWRWVLDNCGPDMKDLLDRTVEEARKDALREFSRHDLHGLIPHSEISNQWYHSGLDAAQREAGYWAGLDYDGNEDVD